jgi:glutathione S-transferase
MTNDLVFYTHSMSRGRIVRWMLEEIGQPDSTELFEYDTTMKRPAYLAINPMGNVPAIGHGETVVTEAAAICAYPADEKRAAFEHYWQRLSARPAALRAREIDDALAAQQPQTPGQNLASCCSGAVTV